MSSRLKAVTWRLEEELLRGLDEIRARDGVSVTEQVRRALTAWLQSKGIAEKKTDRRRGLTRKRQS